MSELPFGSRKPEAEAGDARRWVSVDEAARAAGVSASAVRRWQRAGRIEHRLESGGRRPGRRLVDLDEVLTLRATRAGARSKDAADNVIPFGSAHQMAAELRERLERATETLADAEARGAAAEAEVGELRRRIGELETWLSEAARFEEIEQVQLGRLLALASAEREARRLPLISSARTLLLAIYLLVVVAFVVLLFTTRP
jgi:hypothetical protein